jgi:hypothetical protein
MELNDSAIPVSKPRARVSFLFYCFARTFFDLGADFCAIQGIQIRAARLLALLCILRVFVCVDH